MKKKQPEYKHWRGMINKCYPNTISTSYEQEGIKVYSKWRGKNGFWEFLKDVGKKPSQDHILCRKDTTKDFIPGNCYWGLQTKRKDRIKVFFEGKERLLLDLCRELSINYSTAYKRYKRGLGIEEILSPKKLHLLEIEYKGEIHTIDALCELYGIDKHMFYSRHSAGWDIEDIINEPNQSTDPTRKHVNSFRIDEEKIEQNRKLKEIQKLDSYKEYMRNFNKRL